MTDTNEALGEQMQEESAQELIQGYGHQFLLIVVSRVPPAKADLAVGQRDQSMVGDGDAMGVTAEILEHILDHLFGKLRGKPRAAVVPFTGKANDKLLAEEFDENEQAAINS